MRIEVRRDTIRLLLNGQELETLPYKGPASTIWLGFGMFDDPADGECKISVNI